MRVSRFSTLLLLVLAALVFGGCVGCASEPGSDGDFPPAREVDIGALDLEALLKRFGSKNAEDWREAHDALAAKIEFRDRWIQRLKERGEPYRVVRRVPASVERRLPSALTSPRTRTWLARYGVFRGQLNRLFLAADVRDFDSVWQRCAALAKGDADMTTALAGTLVQCIGRTQRFRQELAAEALGVLTRRNPDLLLGNLLIILAGGVDTITKRFVAEALGSVGKQAIEPVFTELNSAPDPVYRSFLYLALKFMGTQSVNERLRERFEVERDSNTPDIMRMQLLSRIVLAIAASGDRSQAGWILSLVEQDREKPKGDQDRYWQETCFEALTVLRGSPMPKKKRKSVEAWRAWIDRGK